VTTSFYETHTRVSVALAASAFALTWSAAATAQELETETTALVPHGTLDAGAGAEIQTSSEGQEYEAPLITELGLFDRLELIVEPVALAAVEPKSGPSAEGLGDLETTVVGLVLKEKPWLPAIAVAPEVKFPVARNRLLGTGEFDFTGYLILGKTLGPVGVYLNGGYTIVGRPPNTDVRNVWSFAAAVNWDATDDFHVFGEVLGNTSASPESGNEEQATAEGANPEIAGGEFIGTIGAGYWVTKNVDLFLTSSYDNNQAWTIHPGFMLAFDLF
jgi:hypothetical protein